MPNRGNIRRLQRGELSRIDARKGRSTDVYMGPPGGAPTTAPSDDTAQEQFQKMQIQKAKLEQEISQLMKELEASNSSAKVLGEELEDLRRERSTLSEKLAAAEARLEKAQSEAPAEPVKGLRVLTVEESNEADGLVRLDCTVKPTTGPLGDTAAIIIPYAELDKVFEDGENSPEEPSNDAKSEG